MIQLKVIVLSPLLQAIVTEHMITRAQEAESLPSGDRLEADAARVGWRILLANRLVPAGSIHVVVTSIVVTSVHFVGQRLEPGRSQVWSLFELSNDGQVTDVAHSRLLKATQVTTHRLNS